MIHKCVRNRDEGMFNFILHETGAVRHENDFDSVCKPSLPLNVLDEMVEEMGAS